MSRCELFVISIISLLVLVFALPQQQKSKRPVPIFKKKTQGLELPNNATSIRENIVDTFSCDGRIYGYYADVENECQIFHVCLPQLRGSSSRWSFICPGETVFNQATFVCTRTEDSIPCEESDQYYSLNEEIGKVEEEENEERPENLPIGGDYADESPLPFTKVFRRGKSRRIDETTETIQTTTSTSPSSRNARILSRERTRQ